MPWRITLTVLAGRLRGSRSSGARPLGGMTGRVRCKLYHTPLFGDAPSHVRPGALLCERRDGVCNADPFPYSLFPLSSLGLRPFQPRLPHPIAGTERSRQRAGGTGAHGEPAHRQHILELLVTQASRRLRGEALSHRKAVSGVSPVLPLPRKPTAPFLAAQVRQ